jgi:hypothetical protein
MALARAKSCVRASAKDFRPATSLSLFDAVVGVNPVGVDALMEDARGCVGVGGVVDGRVEDGGVVDNAGGGALWRRPSNSRSLRWVSPNAFRAAGQRATEPNKPKVPTPTIICIICTLGVLARDTAQMIGMQLTNVRAVLPNE